MYPEKLTAFNTEDERRGYKVVRRDTLEDVRPGSFLVSASVETGHCLLRLINGETEDFYFGLDGLRIVPK